MQPSTEAMAERQATASATWRQSEHSGWRRADGLRAGDELRTMSGPATIVGLAFTAVRQRVHNLTVRGLSTYHVGPDGVVVHNCESWTAAKRAYWTIAGGKPMAEVVVRNRRTGALETRIVSKELHHINGRDIPNPHDPSNLIERWPWEHEAVDGSRHVGYDLVQFVREWRVAP